VMWAALCGSRVFLVWTGLSQDWILGKVMYWIDEGTLSRSRYTFQRFALEKYETG
jgi:hypothetical protein